MRSKIQFGKILHKSQSSKNLIIKLEKLVHIGDNVFNQKDEKIGEVFDITGPVDSPLASIKLDIENNYPLPGQPVFIKEKWKKKRVRRKKHR